MGRIRELIISFINPAPEEQSFDELAVSAGMEEADINALKKSMGGVSWKFDEEIEETKKAKRPKVDSKAQVQKAQGAEKSKEVEKDSELER